MAINSTVFKFKLNIADLDRGYYADHALTVARHPSETSERMMVRVLAFALYASERLAFGKGLSADDEPALWDKDLTEAISLWIDVGLPDERNIRRACGRADQVIVLLYGGRIADMWWSANEKLLGKNRNLTVRNVAHESSKALAKMAERNLDLQCTIQEQAIWIDDGSERIQVEITTLRQAL